MLANDGAFENTAANVGDNAQSSSNKLLYWLLGFLVVYVIIRGVAGAAIRPFFFDELITGAVVSQPSANDIWNSLAHAVDSHPPLFYLAEKAASAMLNNKHIALRLPSILALPCTLICVFVYLKKRNSERVAFLAAALLLVTNLYLTYSTDARAYSMLIACIAFALVCYQRVPSLFWTAMLGLSLALAESLHYYAIFSMLPFWVAEAVHFFRGRRFRWRVWATLAFGFVPLLFSWPLLLQFRAYYGPYIWTHYGLTSIPQTYGSFFYTGGAFGVAIVAVCAAGVISARLRPDGLRTTETGEGASDPVEGALLLALLALPFPAYIITKIGHGTMTDHYVLAVILGIVLSLACAMSMASRRVLALVAIFVLSTIFIHELSFWRNAHSLRLENPAMSIEAFVEQAGYPELPVIVSSGHRYLQLSYYASPEWKYRFVFLEDEQKAVQYTATDSIDKNLVVLRRYTPLRMDEFSEFVSCHSRFLLYVEDPGIGFDWLPSYLPRVAASVQALVVEPTQKVYLVTMKENPSH
jgi:hypothetical protein